MRFTVEDFELKNYRSCQSTKAVANPGLNIMIGPNGAGKTNILHGLLLLRKLASADGHHRGMESAPSICRLHASFRVGSRQASLRAKISYATNDQNQDEILDTDEQWNVPGVTGEDDWVSLPPLHRSVVSPQLTAHDFLTLRERMPVAYWRYAGSPRMVETLRAMSKTDLGSLMSTVQAVYDGISGMCYYSASQFTDPSRCPLFIEFEEGRPSRRHAPRGREHTEFVQDLYLAFKQQSPSYSEYLQIIGKSGLNLVDRISFREVRAPSSIYSVRIGGRLTKQEMRRQLVIPSFKIGSMQLSPNQLSEGTFKALALVFHIVTDRTRLLLIEEPEVCVHHGLLASIVDLVKSVSKRRQVFMSTHSDLVLDAVSPFDVFVVRNDRDKGTVMKHVPKSMSARQFAGLKMYLKQEGNLGEYWRHSGLEEWQ